jgi:hypothetical protein
VTGTRAAQRPRLAHIPDDAFPRAEFGLPIVFHFQGQGEPPDTVLYPSGAERMASPLILKPLALANGKAVPLILQLVTPIVDALELKPANKAAAQELDVSPDTELLGLRGMKPIIRGPELARRTSPLAGSQKGSALDAFLNRARARESKKQEEPVFREVKR